MKPRRNKIFRLLAPTLLVTVLIIMSSPIAYAGSKARTGGEAFTAPSEKFPMPAEWTNKPIKYGKWAEKADIAVSLEQDVYQIIFPLIQKYAKEQNLRIDVKEGTCGIAAGMLSQKTVDIGGFCCPAGKEDRLPGIRFHTLGIVGKAFLVHHMNPVDNVTPEQLRDIFSGKIYKWSEIRDNKGKPGPDWTIRTIGRLHCQRRPGHWRLLLDNEKLFSPRMYEVGSIPDMLSTVANTREAIGWEVLSMVEKYKQTKHLKALRINGHRPNDPEALASGKYPFYRTYNITTWEGKGVENIRAQKLVDYLMKEFDRLDPAKYGFASSARLRKAGWKFKGDELTGTPK